MLIFIVLIFATLFLTFFWTVTENLGFAGTSIGFLFLANVSDPVVVSYFYMLYLVLFAIGLFMKFTKWDYASACLFLGWVGYMIYTNGF